MSDKVIGIDPDFRAGSGVACNLGWARLEETLKASGELKSNEHITGVVVNDYGIQYYIKKND